MNFRRTRKLTPSVELTPLIDVVFLLLIFFMVSSTLVKDTALSITLPEASSAYVISAHETIDVFIDQDGNIAVNDLLLLSNDRDEIRKAISAAAGQMPKPALAIQADALATHETVVQVLDVAKELGLLDVSILTRQQEIPNSGL